MDKEEILEEIPEEEKTLKKDKKKKKENKEIEALKSELALVNEKVLRLSAENQNMKRRNEEEKMKLLKYDGENIITSLLPILDNFEHAVLMDDTDLSDELSQFLKGFKMIYGNMVEALKKYGVEEIKCLHEPFDDNTMHAVLVDETEEFENDIVIDVMQKGYMYKDKVIRPAMVKVNKR